MGVHHSAMSPQIIELYGHLGLDYVIVSSEVESLDKYTMENLLRAADAAKTVPVVKVLRNDPDADRGGNERGRADGHGAALPASQAHRRRPASVSLPSGR